MLETILGYLALALATTAVIAVPLLVALRFAIRSIQRADAHRRGLIVDVPHVAGSLELRSTRELTEVCLDGLRMFDAGRRPGWPEPSADPTPALGSFSGFLAAMAIGCVSMSGGGNVGSTARADTPAGGSVRSTSAGRGV